MVERFNGRVAEVIKQTRLESAAELESTLENYVAIYNHHIPQRALDHLPPIKAMQQWQQERPELFVKRIYNQRRDLTSSHVADGTGCHGRSQALA